MMFCNTIHFIDSKSQLNLKVTISYLEFMLKC